MEPFSAIALGSVILSGAKAGMGLGQLLTNKRPERPTYETPDEIGGILDIAKRRAGSSMPGIDTMKGDVGTATAEAFTMGKQTGRFDIGSMFEHNVKGMRDINLMDAQFKLGAEDQLKQAMGLVASYKDKEFEYNEAGKYDDELADFFAKRQSGVENLFGGFQGMMDTGMSYAQFSQMEGLWDALEPDFMTMRERQAEKRSNRAMKKGMNSSPIFGNEMSKSLWS